MASGHCDYCGTFFRGGCMSAGRYSFCTSDCLKRGQHLQVLDHIILMTPVQVIRNIATALQRSDRPSRDFERIQRLEIASKILAEMARRAPSAA